MSKYKEFKVTHDGAQYVFVTRGRSKPFSAEEALAYLTKESTKVKSEIGLRFPNKPVVPTRDVTFEETAEAVLSTWRIPDDKLRRHMFRKDLQSGMPFCIKKYGQSAEVIEAEAKRLALGGF